MNIGRILILVRPLIRHYTNHMCLFADTYSQLFRGIGSSAGTSRRSSCSDEVFDDIDGNLMELNDKVSNSLKYSLLNSTTS